MAVLTSKGKIKRALQIPSSVTEFDALLATLATEADDFILAETAVGALSEEAVSETLDVDGDGVRDLRLSRFPVNTAGAAALTDDGCAVLADDYYLEEHGEVRLIGDGAFFTPGRQKVEITYRAGPTSADVRQLGRAATLWAALQFHASPQAGISSERADRHQIRMQSGEERSKAEQIVDRILAKYVEVFA